MFFTLVTSFLISLSVSLILCPAPLIMALWVLMLALSSACIIGYSIYSWFGIMLFLIYVGGMLVMFAYFLATQPNQHMNMLIPFILLFSTALISVLMVSPIMPPYTKFNFPLSTLININYLPIMIMLALILFIALLMAVKLASLTKGPLRPYNYV